MIVEEAISISVVEKAVVPPSWVEWQMASLDEEAVVALEKAVEKAQEAVQRQGDIVRGLKAEMKEGRVVRVRD